MKPERFDAKIVVEPGKRRPDWNASTSPYGYVLGEALSAMGKEIRRGNEFEAVFWAHQMAISGAVADDFLWERLGMTAVEDCGLANQSLITTIMSLKQMYYALPEYHEDRLAVAAHAVACLARSPKSRYTHELYHAMAQRLRRGELHPEIPDYALDKHTKRGRQMGRGEEHFIEEGAMLANEVEFGTRYRNELRRMAGDDQKNE